MLENREGKKIPDLNLRVRDAGQWKDLSTEELFSGKNVIAFSLPGAFTPTCSSAHVPRYNELAKTFKDNGIDEIVCFSVNDPFVMEEWQKSQNADNIRFVPDGNGEFTEKMGMLVDKSNLNFGKRSWRYSMLVKDGIIDKMFIEPEVDGDPYEVSDADTMLDYINPNADKPQYITLFTKAGCPHCARAKELLKDNNYDYEEIELNNQVTGKSLFAVSGGRTTPQVFVSGRLIGTADDLENYIQENNK